MRALIPEFLGFNACIPVQGIMVYHYLESGLFAGFQAKLDQTPVQMKIHKISWDY